MARRDQRRGPGRRGPDRVSPDGVRCRMAGRPDAGAGRRDRIGNRLRPCQRAVRTMGHYLGGGGARRSEGSAEPRAPAQQHALFNGDVRFVRLAPREPIGPCRGAGSGPGSRVSLQPPVHLRRRRSGQDAPFARDRLSSARHRAIRGVHNRRRPDQRLPCGDAGEAEPRLSGNATGSSTCCCWTTSTRSKGRAPASRKGCCTRSTRSANEAARSFSRAIGLPCPSPSRSGSSHVWAAGLQADLASPGLESRIALLHAFAQQAGMELHTDVSSFIAERLNTNGHVLKGALTRLLALADLTGHRITPHLARQALAAHLSTTDTHLSPDSTLAAVARYYSLPTSALEGPRRDREASTARQTAMHLLHTLLGLSPEEIGVRLGNRERTTIIYGLRRMTDRLPTDATATAAGCNNPRFPLRRGIPTTTLHTCLNTPSGRGTHIPPHYFPHTHPLHRRRYLYLLY